MCFMCWRRQCICGVLAAYWRSIGGVLAVSSSPPVLCRRGLKLLRSVPLCSKWPAPLAIRLQVSGFGSAASLLRQALLSTSVAATLRGSCARGWARAWTDSRARRGWPPSPARQRSTQGERSPRRMAARQLRSSCAALELGSCQPVCRVMLALVVSGRAASAAAVVRSICCAVRTGVLCTGCSCGCGPAGQCVWVRLP